MERSQHIGVKFPVLDHGHVILLDYMGGDDAVVQSARTSYGEGTKSVSDDRSLIRYLLRKRHSTPFESCALKFHVKLPIFVERQWARHRTANWNEVSARYSILPEEYYVPKLDAVCEQSSANKQGRGETMAEEAAAEFIAQSRGSCVQAFDVYREALNKGTARELARIALPVATYTEKVWGQNLHNLLHFLGLRLDAHAQWEIRQYADVIGRIVADIFPATWEAFTDFRLESVSLSRLDRVMLEMIVLDGKVPVSAARFHELQLQEWRNLKRCSERDECLAKLIKLKLVDPDLS